MPIDPAELLDLSGRLIGDEPGASEADLRRGVSTAYYALFHLLIKSAMGRFISEPAFRPRFARALQHGPMKAVCEKFFPKKQNAKGSYITATSFGFEPIAVPSQLREVAGTFIDLHGAREQADYDDRATVQHADALNAFQNARDAFQAWAAVSDDPSSAAFLEELVCRSIIKR